MKLIYNGVDIYPDISLNYCVHEMQAEKQADTLVLRFNDVRGVWSKWQPKAGDTVRLQEGAGDSGKMFVYSTKPENGLFTVRAMSLPPSAATKKSKSWEGVRFLQLANEIAAAHGLTFQNYGCADQVYPYLAQNNETDFSLFCRLCTLEGCQMLIYDGRLLAYNEAYIEGQPATGEINVDKGGVYTYRDDRAAGYGSCEVASGVYSGTFKAPGSTGGAVLRPASPIAVTSNGEAARFAKGLLRNANKHGQRGQLSRSLMLGYAAASLLTLKTDKASAWDGTVFLHKVRHDYVGNKSTLYFRGLLEGY